jgi:hypothetical protein
MLISDRAIRIFACAAAVLSLAVSGQANAVVAFSIGADNGVDPGFAPSEVSVVTFDGPNAAGVTETDNGPGGSVALFSGTTVNLAAVPVGDPTLYEAIQPGASAKFDFTGYAPGVGSLSVYLGSIDTYNMFEVSTNEYDYFYDGADFLNNDGAEYSYLTNRRVYFQFADGEILKSITYSSGGIAFEYDTMAASPAGTSPWVPTGPDVEPLFPTSMTPVPEPAAWALMLIGFAVVGFGARRRRTALAA